MNDHADRWVEAAFAGWPAASHMVGNSNENQWFVGLSPLPVTVTTRIIPFLVGNPYKPSFPLLLGGWTTQMIWHIFFKWIKTTVPPTPTENFSNIFTPTTSNIMIWKKHVFKKTTQKHQVIQQSDLFIPKRWRSLNHLDVSKNRVVYKGSKPFNGWFGGKAHPYFLGSTPI